jgi:DNA-directed RNA polymerase beta' subunit
MRLAFFISILFLISSCAKHEQLLDFSGEFKLSTDVAHFMYVQTIPRIINGKTCDYAVKEYEVIKTFKGELKQGELIRVLATGNEVKGDESILLLYRESIDDYREPNNCVVDRVQNYKSVMLSYVIKKDSASNKSVVFFEMPNSETRGPDILIGLRDVYSKLEEFGEKYSNKAIKSDS